MGFRACDGVRVGTVTVDQMLDLVVGSTYSVQIGTSVSAWTYDNGEPTATTLANASD